MICKHQDHLTFIQLIPHWTQFLLENPPTRISPHFLDQHLLFLFRVPATLVLLNNSTLISMTNPLYCLCIFSSLNSSLKLSNHLHLQAACNIPLHLRLTFIMSLLTNILICIQMQMLLTRVT